MTTSPQPVRRIRFRHIVLLFLFVFTALMALVVIGVVGLFWLGSDTRALERHVTRSVGVPYHKKIAIHLGRLPVGLVQLGARAFKMPSEPRTALNALKCAEVCVYDLEQDPNPATRSALFTDADREMTARGWERVVAVAQPDVLVAVYVPRSGISSRHVRCCVAVLHERTLVIAGASGNLDPILALASNHLHLHEKLLARN